MKRVPNPTGKGGWSKGKSGNPSGRPAADKEIQELALTKSRDAFAKIASLMDSAEDERIQLSAADKILERAYGKARQTLEHDMKGNVSVTVNITRNKPPSGN